MECHLKLFMKKIPNLFEKFVCRKCEIKLRKKLDGYLFSFPFYFDKVFLSPWKSLFKFSFKKNDLWHIALHEKIEKNFEPRNIEIEVNRYLTQIFFITKTDNINQDFFI